MGDGAGTGLVSSTCLSPAPIYFRFFFSHLRTDNIYAHLSSELTCDYFSPLLPPFPGREHLFYIVRNAQQVGADYGQTALLWRSAASVGDPGSREREGLLFEAPGHTQ